MTPFKALSLVLSVGFFATQLHAYEVWMGTHLSTSEQADNLSTWSLVASQLEGVNINRAPHDTDPASNTDHRRIYSQFTNATSMMTEFARSEATRDPERTDELAFPSIRSRLEEIFGAERTFDYDLTILMFYDERGTFRGTEYLYQWTETEIQFLRDWMDENGHADVELMWNVRNNGVRNRELAVNPLVDSVQIESSTTAFLANTNNQRTFFDWYWTNSATSSKPIALQLPRVLPGDPLDQFQGTRRVAQSLAGTIGYGDDGMRSDRLIFLPVTYNDDFATIPETVSEGAAYTTTLASICLSLIEQRELFEGRLPQLPTLADADSKVRTVPPTISPLIDRVVNRNSSTPAIPIRIGDTDTPVSSISLSATSSNPQVVPVSGIVFGGSGGNRTVIISPAQGQSGMSEITITANDGKWNASSTFTLTVGGVLISQAADAAVKDDPVPSEQSANTGDIGSGGNSPFTDRCVVYVFQLPGLGATANPFTGASFNFNYASKDGTAPGIDLYGLGRRDAATVLAGDYYGQSTSADPTDATRLQSNVLNNSTPLGVISTSSGGNSALANYLNSQYASGAGAGKFVFLRLSSRVPKSGINRAEVTMSEGGVSNLTTDTRPRIAYTTMSDPGIGGLADISMRQDTSTAIPFTISNMNPSSLVVTANSSNTGLVSSPGLIVSGSGLNRTLTITPVAGQSGQTEVTILANNGSQSASFTFNVTVLRALLATIGDAEIQPTLGSPLYEVINQNLNSLLVGTAGGTVGRDRSVVFPFELPDLGAVANPFNSARFTVNHVSSQNSPLGNVSVYGLEGRSSELVLPDDYWSATAEIDPTDATLLQPIFIPAGSTNFGIATTDAAGGSNLVDYLNAQYAGGSGIGKYVFLRLSADQAQVGGASRYVFTSANGAATNPLTRPQINFLTNDQVENPTVTLIALGSAVDLTAGSSWSDGLPAHPSASYVIPNNGNLRSENGTSTFPGFSLTVLAGGRFQARSLEGSGQVTTVERLILEGGSSFAPGNFAEVVAGTGVAETNVLAGSISNSGYSRFFSLGTAGGNNINRSLKVQSLIAGFGRIQVLDNSGRRLSAVIIDNPINSFYGTWEVAPGSTLTFDNAGAVGTADIEVQSGGVLEIKGNWSAVASLTVTDAPETNVKLGTFGWRVSELNLGGGSVADGTYTAADLNGLAANDVFTGLGTITVGAGLPGGPIAHWKLDEATGNTAIDSSGGGKSGTLLHGATWGSDTTRGSFVSFDGDNDRISTLFTYALSNSDDFTWTWWANKQSTDGNDNNAVMVGNRYSGGGSESLEFIKFTPQKATFVNGGLDDREDYNYTGITDDGWHHYAMVKSGARYQWYVNGVPQGDPITINYSETDLLPFNIGGDDNDATPGGQEGEHFRGFLDDVALYDRPLTPAEIRGVRDGNYGFLPPNTAQEDWRMTHFGTTDNTGNASDSFDVNFDGESNLLEFATGQNPYANTSAAVSVTMNGASMEFRYTRSNAAAGDGILFAVEWTDTLAPTSWSSAGVSDVAAPENPENPGNSELQERIATIPLGTLGKRFVRLKVTR